MTDKTLICCDRCGRHVYVRETRCPFCATPRSPVVVALAVAGALVGCPPRSRQSAEVYGAPSAPVTRDPEPSPAAPPDGGLVPRR